jgi:hypothetical protein
MHNIIQFQEQDHIRVKECIQPNEGMESLGGKMVAKGRQQRIAHSIIKPTTKGKIGKTRRASLLKHRLKTIPFRWERK